mgnify:CR=1 FL=1
MHNSVLKVSNIDDTVLGTGFVVHLDEKGTYVVTCGHVVNDCGDSIFVEGNQATIVANHYSEGIDLAVLHLEDLKIEPLKISDKNIDVDSVRVIGFSKLLGHSKREEISEIKIKLNVELSKGSSAKVQTIKLYPNEEISYGYSGSPVICEATNNVIGIVNIQQGQGKNYAISSSHLLQLHDFIENDSIDNKNNVKTCLLLTENQRLNITQHHNENLNSSLRAYNSQKNIWIDPHLDKVDEKNAKSNDASRIEISDIVKNPRSILLKYGQQYGATSLSHYLIDKAWNQAMPSFWLYLDSHKLKPHEKQIEKNINKTLKNLGLAIADVDCVILDEFSNSINNADKIFQSVSSIFKNKPLITMYSNNENPLLSETIKLPREFEKLHLWALNRNSIRKLVNCYNNESYIEEENRVVNKVVADLESLNIPRTPQNCLTILKISEIEFDDSPVNRTEMIRRVLHLLFNVDDIPHYKTRPDLKDTEFTLGFFCEKIIRTKNNIFSREGFIKDLNSFCENNGIELDVHIIFDVLYANNIIVMRGSNFCFKFTYWVFYFAAHRMLQSHEFASFIFQNRNYLAYPELIEFYTGIDRRRDDPLNVILKDMIDINITVKNKCDFPEGFNVFDIAKWLPTDSHLEKIREEVSNNVTESNLPDAIKDDYADRKYDRSRPLNQNIYTILEEYSLLRLMKGISAGSVALRNSDYSTLEIRGNLLSVMLSSWVQLTEVLVALSPTLASQGYAEVEGASFVLTGELEDEPMQKLNQVISALPSNVIDWYVDLLFSPRMGPLIKKGLEKESNKLTKHYLHLVLIAKRPKDWEKLVEEYIFTEDKNSFYLHNVLECLNSEYRYSFSSLKNIKNLEHLIKVVTAKHDLGVKKPNNKPLNKLSNWQLPKRDVL